MGASAFKEPNVEAFSYPPHLFPAVIGCVILPVKLGLFGGFCGATIQKTISRSGAGWGCGITAFTTDLWPESWWCVCVYDVMQSEGRLAVLYARKCWFSHLKWMTGFRFSRTHEKQVDVWTRAGENMSIAQQGLAFYCPSEDRFSHESEARTRIRCCTADWKPHQ